MLDELLSREDLKKQVDYYDSEIARLTQEIADKQDVKAVHQRQLDSIKEYIKQVNMTAEHNINDTGFFSQLLKKAVVIDRNNSEFYLNCVPFGFRMRYSIHKYNRGHQYDVSIDKCETIL